MTQYPVEFYNSAGELRTDLCYQTSLSAGFDITAAVDTIAPVGKTVMVHTDLYMKPSIMLMEAIKNGYCMVPELQIRSRSGLAYKYGISVANGVGTIDADFAGEICVLLHNSGDNPFVIVAGDRIAQGVFAFVYRPANIPVKNKERGTGGFGSSGK